MSAAHKDIIIEKGSSFVMKIQATTSGTGLPIDINGYTPEIVLKYIDKGSVKYVYDANNKSYVSFTTVNTKDNTIVDASNGKFMIKLNSTITNALSTLIGDDIKNKFATEYNYSYDILLTKYDTSVDPATIVDRIKVVRGRCAVRL